MTEQLGERVLALAAKEIARAKELLEVHVVAKRLGVSQSHVRALCRSHELTSVRVGKRRIRIPAAAVDQFILERTA